MVAERAGVPAAVSGDRQAVLAELRDRTVAGVSLSTSLSSTSSIVEARQPMPTLSPTFSESVFGERAVIVHVTGPCSVVSVSASSVNVATVPA